MPRYVGALRTMVLVSFIVLLVLSVTAQAQTGGGAAESGADGSELTAEERARFVQGAKKVGGLDDKEIARVLKDPELIDDIPVKVRTTSKTGDPIEAARDGLQPRAAEECGTKQIIIEFMDINNEVAFKWVATNRWCIDRQRVTSGNMNDVQTWIRADEQYQPDKGGWRYIASAEFGTDEFKTWNGHANGAHRSTRAGKFEYFLPGNVDVDTANYPGAVAFSRYDGICVTSTYSPKEPVIESGPSGSTKSTSATFAFSHVDPNTTFECSRDGAAAVPCSSPKTYQSLVEGTHSLRLQGVNSLGNALPRPPLHTWAVDLTAPRVTSVDPAAGATGVGANRRVEALLNEEVRATSVLGNFTLTKRGTTTPVEASLGYNPNDNKAILDPTAALEPGATYVAALNGGSGGVKDLAGNPLASDKVWSFTVAP